MHAKCLKMFLIRNQFLYLIKSTFSGDPNTSGDDPSLLHSESIAYFSLSKNRSRSFVRCKGSLIRWHNYNKTLGATSISSFITSLGDMPPFSFFSTWSLWIHLASFFKSKLHLRHNVANTGKVKEPSDSLSCCVSHLPRHWWFTDKRSKAWCHHRLFWW